MNIRMHEARFDLIRAIERRFPEIEGKGGLGELVRGWMDENFIDLHATCELSRDILEMCEDPVGYRKYAVRSTMYGLTNKITEKCVSVTREEILDNCGNPFRREKYQVDFIGVRAIKKSEDDGTKPDWLKEIV